MPSVSSTSAACLRRPGAVPGIRLHRDDDEVQSPVPDVPALHRGQHGGRLAHGDRGDFEKIAGALFPYVDRFQLTVSGEPLMTKGLGRMLELAEEYGVRAEYYTNGTLLNDRMISLILPTLGEMCISFDGATKETFEYMRAGATFESVLRNVERLAAALRRDPAARRGRRSGSRHGHGEERPRASRARRAGAPPRPRLRRDRARVSR